MKEIRPDVAAEGVPEITPVVELRVNPAGRAGEIEKESTFPPVEVGVRGVMVLLTTKEVVGEM